MASTLTENNDSHFIKVNETCGYFLYQVDTFGYEVKTEAGYTLDAIEAELRGSPTRWTDVIVISHGYNTKKEEDGSIKFCNIVVGKMNELCPEGTNPLYICVHWPSHVIQPSAYRLPRTADKKRFITMRDKIISKNNIHRQPGKDGFTKKKQAEIFDFLFRRNRSLTEGACFGRFIHTASTVGARGVHLLFGHLMQFAPVHVRFHAFGHSLGGQVVSSAAIGAAPGSLLTRKLHTLMVFQGAVGARAYSVGGPYRPLKSTLKPVAGPLLFTYMRDDIPLSAYHTCHKEPVGLCGLSDTSGEDVRLGTGNESELQFAAGKTYSLNGNGVIENHSNYNNPAVIGAFWRSVQTSISAEELEMTSSHTLPANYWTDYSQRSESNNICWEVRRFRQIKRLLGALNL